VIIGRFAYAAQVVETLLSAPRRERSPSDENSPLNVQNVCGRSSAHPDAEWVMQQARQVAWTIAERAEPVRFLIRDHDRKFTHGFDAVFEAEHIRTVRTPIQAPEANGIAERFVRTARSECLDWLLILSARHLEHALSVFIDHYNSWRPHRSLDLAPPNGRTSAARWAGMLGTTVKRRDRLGGLLHEYEHAV
jgi:hypothetical protein